MTKTIEVETSVGKWVVKKPKAGVRNRALAAAESDSGNLRYAIFMATILPDCIQERPDSFDRTVPLKQQLDDLEIEDYDALVNALKTLISEHEKGEEKKTP